MREINLTNGGVALVDDADFDRVFGYPWYSWTKRGITYARTKLKYLHRVVLGEPPGLVDHRDRDGLNCQRYNLRLATTSQNCANARKPRMKSSSKYKGVHWENFTGRWRAGISCKKKHFKLGRFDSELGAAKAYDAAALKHFGEFASLNFPA